MGTNRIEALRLSLERIGQIARDEGGNVLYITAFSLLPMIGMVGSGVDMSRAYMAKTRLQAACDTGVLAGRKAMGDSGTYDAAAKQKATKMFDFNFDKTSNGALSVTFTTTPSDNGQVIGQANASIKTVVMHIFNKPSIEISALCEAELQLASADVMFVLDSTGSMACAPEDSTSACTSYINQYGYTEKSNSRMVGLRDAVRDFHKTLSEAITNHQETRIRYGFVPYSSAINVKDLISDGNIPLSYLSDKAKYQTRLARYNTPIFRMSNIRVIKTTRESTYFNSKNQCQSWYDNYGENPVIISGSKPENVGDSNDVVERVYSNGTWNRGNCARDATERQVTYTFGGFEFTEWVYKQQEVDVSTFKNGSVTYANGAGGTVSWPGEYDLVELPKATGASGILTSNGIWEGCIEERATVQNLAMNPVPAGATDLDIINAPTSDDTKWKPMFDDIFYNRSTDGQETTTRSYSKPQYYCPSSMRGFRTADMTSSAPPAWLATYLTNMLPTGGTYHDIGMIWGARLSSQRGINATNVNEGDMPNVSRHIIFMTDGQMDPGLAVYSSYGVENMDHRVAPRGASETDLANYHNSRFLAACRRARGEGYVVWVIGFGTTLSNEMRQCASDNRAFQSDNTTALKEQFRFIATQIADLRLSQ